MILQKVLGSDKNEQQSTDSYINDIAVNLDVVSCEKVMKTLDSFGSVSYTHLTLPTIYSV